MGLILIMGLSQSLANKQHAREQAKLLCPQQGQRHDAAGADKPWWKRALGKAITVAARTG